MLDEYELERLEAAQERAEEKPLPLELETRIGLWIEPHTMNVEAEHADVMEAIELAYPLIVDWLREHPEEWQS